MCYWGCVDETPTIPVEKKRAVPHTFLHGCGVKNERTNAPNELIFLSDLILSFRGTMYRYLVVVIVFTQCVLSNALSKQEICFRFPDLMHARMKNSEMCLSKHSV